MGAVHERDTCALPGVAARPVGEPGTVEFGANGVADVVTDAGPRLPPNSALTRNTYSVPFVRPVTVAVVGAPVSTNVIHTVADAARYSTMYLFIP